jgi:hypothetical protein
LWPTSSLSSARLPSKASGWPADHDYRWRHVVGPLAELRGLYVVGGCCVRGLSIAPIIGDLLAEWIISANHGGSIALSRLVLRCKLPSKPRFAGAAAGAPSITGRTYLPIQLQPHCDSRRPDDCLQRDELLRPHVMPSAVAKM